MIHERSKRIAAARSWQFLGEDETGPVDLAEELHEASKFYRSTVARMVRSDKLRDPDVRASIAIGARELAHLPLVRLPTIEAEQEYRTHDSLIRRPSCRAFTQQDLSAHELGRLLWLTYGVYSTDSGGQRRPVASGGALYPLEIYVITRLQGDGHKGLYHYNVPRHGLEVVRERVDERDLRRLGEPSGFLASAPVIVIIASLFGRSRFKYGLRGYRFALMEAGAFMQQMTLVAQALNLGALPFAGFFDDVVEELCELDGVDESFVNGMILGTPR